MASAIAVVWSKHQARSLFIQLQALTSERDALDIEWGQLKLEQSAWATHGRVEQTARVDLRMVIPRSERSAYRRAVGNVTPATPYQNMIRPENKSFSQDQFRGRLRFVLGALTLIAAGLVARAVDLQVLDDGFLEGQGDARYTRIAKLSANRGGIYDRNGESLAASTPVDTVWACPPEVMRAADQIPLLAEALNRDKKWLTQVITSNLDREFVYLVRHMRPSDAAQVAELKIPGVYLLREYQRFYPAGEVTGHLLGFTKKYDDIGQEGLELAYDRWLGAEAGKKRVIQDRYGRTVEDVESISAARPGEDLITSIDLRIQYLAYRELKAAVQEHKAKAGSVVVLDIETGEVLAMVNQPAYNPNDRDQVAASRYRNRAATDIFEPGSSIKPFIAAAGIASGRYHPDTIIDTSPGFVRVGVKTIPDKHNLGAISLTTVLAKSSNVGMTKMAMTLSPQSMRRDADGVRLRRGHRQRISRANLPVCSTSPRTGAKSARRRFPMGTACRSRRCSLHARTPCSARAASSVP